MKTKTKQILGVLKVVSWIIFFGLCIQTGAIIFTFIYSFFNPIVAQNLYLGLDLSNLYNAEIGSYSYIVSSLIILSGLKAYMFFLVVKIFLIINFQNPFKIEIASLIARISYIAFAVWILSVVSNFYMGWLIKNGIGISDVGLQKYMGGSSEFFFLGLIVFAISQIFKRGIELQSENELTI
tara:strand:- start:2001 stop:2543 length:543 start_codon:yes stop_codon:yes gene_type:complete